MTAVTMMMMEREKIIISKYYIKWDINLILFTLISNTNKIKKSTTYYFQ